MVQPILDKYCISCHDARHKSLDLRANPAFYSGAKKTFDSSYINLIKTQGKYVDWITQQSKAAPITQFPAPGSGTSPLADTLLKNHNKVNMTPEEREVLFCWMDMMVPHGGSYYEGMKPEDSAKYVTYLNNNRNKHIEWEKENCKTFIDAGQWKNAIYQDSSVTPILDPDGQKVRPIAAEEFRAIPFVGRLAVQCPGTGIISFLDMKGRVLKQVTINGAMKNGKQQVFIPWTMPSGIYVVRFNGKGVVRQRVFAFLTTTR
jgi:hypothetical protein